ncbi:MAG: hypothetical protein IJV64_06125, partial [Oscillospiraceae bacterium]|nr:hypothetical protein [Oscillospiraceae bacterium]
MKQKGKALFSLLIVLTLVVQLFTVSAYATGSEGLGLAVYFKDENGQIVSQDAVDFAGSYSVTVGDRTLDGSFSIDALMYGDVRIAPPDGWYVAQAWLSGDGSIGSTSLPLTAADANGSTVVLVKSDAFIQSIDGYGTPTFNDAVLSSYGGYYLLSVLLAQRNPSDPVNITDSYGALLGNYSAAAPGESYQDGAVFAGWRLTYNDNGASVLVQPGAYLTPYASCSLSPVFATQVVLHPADMTATAGDSLSSVLANANVEMLNLPGDMGVSGLYGLTAVNESGVTL